MSITSIVLITLGALTILGLGIYAGKLLFLVKAQTSKQQAVRHKRLASIQSSVQTIAFAIQQQQCDLSEGVIRICRLLEAVPIDPHPGYANHFPATYALFELVKNYPTHQARGQLSKSERRKQDKEREEFESQLENKIIAETQALRNLNLQA